MLQTFPHSFAYLCPLEEFSVDESEFELKLLQSVAFGMLVNLYYSSSQLEP